MRWAGRRNRSSSVSWSKIPRLIGRALDFAAPFCAGRRDMGAHNGGVEHLHEMRRVAHRSKCLEKSVEDSRLAQSPKTLPNAVPVAELGRKRPPSDVVDREVVQCCFLSSCPLSPRRERDPSNTFNTVTQSASVILVSMAGLLEPAPHESRNLRFGNPLGVRFSPFFQSRGAVYLI